jgi:hypothetical protein
MQSQIMLQQCNHLCSVGVFLKLSALRLILSWVCGVTSDLHVGGTFQTIQGLLSLSKCLKLHMLHGCLIAFHSLLHVLIMVVASTRSIWLFFCDLHWELTG